MGTSSQPTPQDSKAEPTCFLENWRNRKSYEAIQIFFKQTVDKCVLTKVVKCNGKNKVLMSSLRLALKLCGLGGKLPSPFESQIPIP